MDKQKIFGFYTRNEKMHEAYMHEVPGVSEQYWEELSDFIASNIDGAIQFMC